MTWPTHAASGIVLTGFGLGVLGYPVTLPLLIIGALGGLAPDLDASDAKIKHLKVSWKSGRRRTRIKPFYLLSEIVATLFGHRGVMHSILAVAFLSVGFYFLHLYVGGALVYYIAFIIGYIAHLLGDGITKAGVPLLFPWKKRIHLLSKWISIKTGSVIEYFILILLIFVFVYWLKVNPDFIEKMLTVEF